MRDSSLCRVSELKHLGIKVFLVKVSIAADWNSTRNLQSSQIWSLSLDMYISTQWCLVAPIHLILVVFHLITKLSPRVNPQENEGYYKKIKPKYN